MRLIPIEDLLLPVRVERGVIADNFSSSVVKILLSEEKGAAKIIKTDARIFNDTSEAKLLRMS